MNQFIFISTRKFNNIVNALGKNVMFVEIKLVSGKRYTGIDINGEYYLPSLLKKYFKK